MSQITMRLYRYEHFFGQDALALFSYIGQHQIGVAPYN